MSNFECVIKVVPHNQQRYNTVGDYKTIDGVTYIIVSAFEDWRYQFLVTYHEMTELSLCREAGVTDDEIDAFDFEFDENRSEGDTTEPGDDPRAPYHSQHLFATKLERKMADELGVDWDDYGNKCKELTASYKN